MRLPKQRRIENKTDYLKRLKLLKSGVPRVTFRKTNRYVIAQYITSKEAQDKIELGITSKKLKEYGWPDKFDGSLKSVPASYLTGFLLGKEIMKNKMKTPIVDFGMTRVLSKNRTFAFIKGLIDAGVEIKCSEEHFPDEERIIGKNMKEDFSKKFVEIKSKIEGSEKTHSTKKVATKDKEKKK
ncbi:MAG: 50S ribosomal protein L18 [Candidatus Nanoarchaeia archaeon]|nr:50S ribosomal protein L18 [Candidatus Nanoarchaeia archaeon]MDD5358185.1 50S ribosomal protein L18 [Candidatus Nanoarchaeia archaeon]MDD5589451.1 50S ribosomal protein L18 [Candidatus Nanoarchaeia archaeon]